MPTSGRSLTDLDYELRHIEDNVTFSVDEIWSWYTLSMRSTDHLDETGKANIMKAISQAFAPFCTDTTSSFEFMVIITTVPHDPNRAIEQAYASFNGINYIETPGRDTMLEDIRQYLIGKQYRHPVAYLGVRFATRAQAVTVDDDDTLIGATKMAFNRGVRIAVKEVASVAERQNETAFVVPPPTQEELTFAKEKEQQIYDMVTTGQLGGRRSVPSELLLHNVQHFHPGMPHQYLKIQYGEAIDSFDINAELSNEVDNTASKYLKFIQEIDGEVMEGYRTTLTIRTMPDEMYLPRIEPLLSRLNRDGRFYNSFIRFKLLSAREMKELLDKKKAAHKDELTNQWQTNRDAASTVVEPASTATLRSIKRARELEHVIDADKTPWVSGHLRIVVESPDLKLLRRDCARIRNVYNTDGITVIQSRHDQDLLFREGLIGGRSLVKDYKHTATLGLLGGTGMTFGAEVGDPITGAPV